MRSLIKKSSTNLNNISKQVKLKPTNVILIRHAESVFNAKCHKYTYSQVYGKEAENQFHHDPSIIDCAITEQAMKIKGQQELVDVFKNKNAKNTGIFVSPMLRTLQTTRLILQNVPNNYNVIAIPHISQVLSKICDFSSGINDKKQQFPQFDFKYVDQWMVENGLCPAYQNWQDPFIDLDLRKGLDKIGKAGKRYLNLLKSNFPRPLQSAQKCQQRSIQGYKKICKICSQQNYKNAIIISHNRILKNIQTEIKKKQAEDFENLQIRQFKLSVQKSSKTKSNCEN